MLARTLCALLLLGAALAFPVDDQNPEEAGFFEGDMDIDPEDPELRAVIISKSKRWPSGTVYYSISSKYSSSEKSKILGAFAEYQKKSCIKFVQRTNQKNYVSVQKLSGCYSKVGMTGGAQTLSLGQGCVNTGTIIHEFLHALGFKHEQSRPDRDTYVTINWQYIQAKKENNFQKASSSQYSTQGIGYDYGSIMHYGRRYFSIDKNKYDTITPKKSGVTIGQRKGFSSSDLKKLKKAYC